MITIASDRVHHPTFPTFFAFCLVSILEELFNRSSMYVGKPQIGLPFPY